MEVCTHAEEEDEILAEKRMRGERGKVEGEREGEESEDERGHGVTGGDLEIRIIGA